MKAPRRRTLATVIAVAALAGAAGCAPQAPWRATTVAAAFGMTDRAWIEITIAMDEQLRPLLALVPRHTADPAVTALANQVRALTDTELPALRGLHDVAGLPAQNPHEGMLMPGLVTAADLAEAVALRGSEFDEFTIEKIEDYLVQGVNLAQSETRFGMEPQTKALAAEGLNVRNKALSSLPASYSASFRPG